MSDGDGDGCTVDDGEAGDGTRMLTTGGPADFASSAGRVKLPMRRSEADGTGTAP